MNVQTFGGRALVEVSHDGLPPELQCLVGTLPPETLWHIAHAATGAGVSPDRVVLAAGHLSAEHYYRSLAQRTGLTYIDRPLRPDPQATVEEVMRCGALALARNEAGLHYLVAPRGDALRPMMQWLQRLDAGARAMIGVTTPDRLEALIRQHRKRIVVHRAAHGLPDWNAALSARNGPSQLQMATFLAVAAACLAACFAPPAAALVLGCLASGLFLASASVRICATLVSPRPDASPVRRAADHELPVYTVVVPLFREARVVGALVKALDRLDYPAAKLDIMLLVEANDPATLTALERMHLPGRYRVIMAPAGHPQTKPRALNVALQFARGAFLVVYDAEDVPDPDQLRRAHAGFMADPRTVCLQAKLAIDNPGDSWLSRVFALEYAALFSVVNPGLAALGLPIPLGGTSNHFRIEVLHRVNGWDAWNVTEDVDLGFRLARFGLRVGTLDSMTFEEAPNTLKAWMAQRRRWQKGWIITLATHTRRPGAVWLELGLARIVAAGAVLGGTVGSSLLGPFFCIAVAVGLIRGDYFGPATAGTALQTTLGASVIVAGAMSLVWPVLLGLHREKRLRQGFAILLLPPYLALLSAAAWLALFEAMRRPFVWAKTDHGRAKTRPHATG